MEISSYNSEFYSRIFGREADMYNRIQGRKIRIVKSMMSVHRKGRMLDVGCGDGRITRFLSEGTGLRPFGVDISPAAVGSARKNGVKAKIHDISKGIPFPDSHFDFAFLGDVVEHVYDTEGLFGETRRILKKGGYAIVSVPNIASWYNRFFLLIGWMPTWIESSSRTFTGNRFIKEGVGHIHAFTCRSLSDLLKLAGFRIGSLRGSPLMGDGRHGRFKEKIWNKADSMLSRFPGLSSTIVVRASRK